MDFEDLFELSARVAQYERLLEEENRRSNALMRTYYQDPNYELDVAKVISTKPITYSTLR